MTAALFIWIYLAAAGAAIACIARAIRYARQPLHLRWEIYPVPHDPTRSHVANHFATAKAMATEILLLRGVWEANRKLWWWSYPFHLGLYLSIITALLAIAGVSQVYAVMRYIAAALVVLGATGLLVRRLKDQKLRAYTVPADIFNLCFFIATLGALIITRPDAKKIVPALLRFDTTLPIAAPQVISLALAAALVLYIPLTHMSHFIAKYFTYHSIRWDDRPLDAKAQAKIAEYLTYRPRWSATHVGADGKKSWAQIATSSPVVAEAGAR